MLADRLQNDLKNLLEEHPFFSLLDETRIEWLAGQCEVVPVRMGETIIREGAEGDAAYLVHSGRLRVFKTGANGKPITLTSLTAGELLGEHSMLSQEPRTASVRAAEDAVLFRLPRDAFTRLMNEQPQLKKSLEQLLEHRSLARFLQTATFLSALSARQVQALIGEFQVVHFAQGTSIIRQGETGQTMYILQSGEAQAVRRHEDGKEVVLSYFGPGDYFGERALLQDEPRYAGVAALTDTTCLSLDRERFQLLLDSSPALQERVRQKLCDYSTIEERAKLLNGSGQVEEIDTPSFDINWEHPSTIQEAGLRRGQPGKKRWLSRKNRYPILYQQDEADCGAAALAMICRSHGVRLSVQRCRGLLETGADGSSVLSMIRSAEELGFECKAVETDWWHLYELPLPAVVHGKAGHYAALYEIKDNQVVLGDPALGLTKRSRNEFERDWTGKLLVLIPTPKLNETTQSPTPFNVLLKRMTEPSSSAAGLAEGATEDGGKRMSGNASAGRLIMPLVLSFGLVLAVAALVLLAQYLVDSLLKDDLARAASLMGGMSFIGLAGLAVYLFRKRSAARFVHHVSYQLSNGMFEQASQPPKTPSMQGLLSILNLPILLAVLIALSCFSFLAAAVSFAAVAVSIALLGFFTPVLSRHQSLSLALHAYVDSERLRLVNNLAAVQQFNHEGHALKYQQFDEEAERVLRRQRMTETILLGTVLMAQLIAILAVSWAGQSLGIGEVNVGRFTTIILLVLLAAVITSGLAYSWPDLVQLWLQLQHVAERQEPQQKADTDIKAETIPQFRGFLRLDEVCFRYSKQSREIISHLSLEARPGPVIWVVGPAGAGKTSLAMLIQRIVSPTSGNIYCDSHNAKDLAPEQFKQLQRIPEHPSIITGTVRENIALANPQAGLEQTIAAAKMSCAHEFIMSLPLGYETTIGDRGIRLSLSERQRLTIARVFLTDPKILLADDATALLDRDLERVVIRNLRTFAAGRTTLFFTRDAKHVLPNEHVVVLIEGRIVEQGTHTELLQQNGPYRYLAGKHPQI